jgi:hypothetical protein
VNEVELDDVVAQDTNANNATMQAKHDIGLCC